MTETKEVAKQNLFDLNDSIKFDGIWIEPLTILRDMYNERNEDQIKKVRFHDIGGFTLFCTNYEKKEVSAPYWMYKQILDWGFEIS